MSNKKLSCVDFLTNQLFKNGRITHNDLKKAKIMHKKEIIKTVQKFEILRDKRIDRLLKKYNLKTNAEEYYNETFIE